MSTNDTVFGEAIEGLCDELKDVRRDIKKVGDDLADVNKKIADLQKKVEDQTSAAAEPADEFWPTEPFWRNL